MKREEGGCGEFAPLLHAVGWNFHTALWPEPVIYDFSLTAKEAGKYSLGVHEEENELLW